MKQANLRRLVCIGLAVVGSQVAIGMGPEAESQRIDVSLGIVGGAIDEALAGRLRAIPSECESVQPLEIPLSGPWRGTLALDTECQWEIETEIQGLWAPTRRILKSERPANGFLEVPLFPVSEVAGTLLVPDANDAPAGIQVELQATSERGEEPIAPFRVACPVQDNSFQCSVPAGNFDLKLTASGFAPRYVWAIQFLRETTYSMEPWKLEPGASLVGWVELEGDPESTGSLPKIALERQVSGWLGDPTKRRRMDLRRFEGATDQHGFFQIAGVDAGGFRLRVEADGFIPLEVRDLAMVQGQELVLKEALVLTRPIDVEVTVAPPTQPDGEPWLLRISLLEPGTTVLQDKITEAIPVTGSWSHTMETLGTHRLILFDAREQIWAAQWLEVMPGLRPVFMEVPLVEVVGRITLGDEPLEAKLVFGSKQGARQVTMQSDSEGRFEGFLPEEGIWPVDLVSEEGGLLHQALPPVTVRKKAGRNLAFLSIELPGTKLTGEVLKGEERVPEAALVFLREEQGTRRREGVAVTDGEGKFSLKGVPPGTLWVHAYLGDSASPWLRVDLAEGMETPPLRLDLEDKIKVNGSVLSPDGEVPGAQITALPVMMDGSSGLSAKAQSDFDGGFSLSLPQQALAADLVVSAPGYAQQILRIPLEADRPNQVMISVDTEAGQLVFRSPDMTTGTHQRTVVSSSTLHHNGAAIPLRYLLTRFLDKMAVRDGGVGILSMPLGEYRLCNTDGSVCEAGYLGPNGELWMNDPPTDDSRVESR